jgi:hypothetical protein
VAQVHISTGDLHNGDPIDADVLRQLLVRLENAINNIDSSQLNPGAVTSDAVAQGVIKLKNLFTDISFRKEIPNPANQDYLEFGPGKTLIIVGDVAQADSKYVAVKTGSALDYLIEVQPQVDCYALLSARVRVQVTAITPATRSGDNQHVQYMTVGMHDVNATVGNPDYGKVVNFGADLESDLINSASFERQFDLTAMMALNAGQTYNFATCIKFKTENSANSITGKITRSPRFTCMGVLLFPRGA